MLLFLLSVYGAGKKLRNPSENLLFWKGLGHSKYESIKKLHTWFKSYSNWLILLIVGGLFSIFRLLCSCVWWCLSVCPLLGLGLPWAKHRYFLCIEKSHTRKREHWHMCAEFSQVIIKHLFSGVYIQQVSGGHIGQKKTFEINCMTRGQ